MCRGGRGREEEEDEDEDETKEEEDANTLTSFVLEQPELDNEGEAGVREEWYV